MDEVKLQRTTIPIGALVDSVDRQQIRLPEIQRDYVWKPAQIAGLLDSLYREYPSGSILLWETDESVEERSPKFDPTGAPPLTRSVQYLLDGQQRLTSLHRVFHESQRDEPDRAMVVFSVEDERFQIQSAATARDPRWVLVHAILRETDLFAYVDQLSEKVPGLDRKEIGKRLSRLQAISKYLYHVEIISNLPYEEVTEIFIRVNSKGRALKTTDLALAALSVRWRGVMKGLEDERDHWRSKGWPSIDLAFLARAIAAVATESRTLAGFKDTPQPALEAGFVQVKHGLRHLTKLLQNNAGIETSSLIPSSNALVPIVAYLGTRPETPLPADEGKALLYWLFGAFLTGRYNQSGDTRIAEDAKAVREADPIDALYKNLGLLGGRLEVTEQGLAGKGAGSPYFLLSYLAARRAGATDWFHGIRIGLDADGSRAIEYHHIHPQATLKKSYSKAEVNDLANLAFISSRANKRISNRSPERYFPELGDDELGRHFVPLDPSLRVASAYPDFIRERRRLLAVAMTEFLDSFRPPFVRSERTVEAPRERLTVTLYMGRDIEPAQRLMEFRAQSDGTEWVGVTKLLEVQRFLSDLDDGLSAALEVSGETVMTEGATERLEFPIGPFLVTGTLDEWRAMVEREIESAEEVAALPVLHPSAAWTAERAPFPVAETE